MFHNTSPLSNADRRMEPSRNVILVRSKCKVSSNLCIILYNTWNVPKAKRGMDKGPVSEGKVI
jgi:hypothetical protein